LIEQGRIKNYVLAKNVDAGEPCEPGGNCAAIPTYSCRGGSYINLTTPDFCDVTRFTEIYDAVRQLAPKTILPEDLKITYENSDLGRATESYIPLVTVELQQTRILSSFKMVSKFITFGSTTTPTVAAAFVGENMGN